MNEEILERLEFIDEPLLKMNGLDKAVIGFVEGAGQPLRLLYDYEKILTILMERDRMTRLEAIEFYEYNISCCYMGEYTPLIAEIIQ